MSAWLSQNKFLLLR